MKQCKRCGAILPLHRYGTTTIKGKRIVRNVCKMCCQIQDRKTRNRNPKRREYALNYQRVRARKLYDDPDWRKREIARTTKSRKLRKIRRVLDE
jgi:hypothetical protein